MCINLENEGLVFLYVKKSIMMERVILLKPNQVYHVTQGGLVTCIVGQIRLVKKHSNIVYKFETLSPNHPNNNVTIQQDITEDFIINTHHGMSTISIT